MRMKADDSRFRVKIEAARKALDVGIRAGLHEVMDQVGLRAVRDHMIAVQGLRIGPGRVVTAPTRLGRPADPGRLTSRSGRLAGSMMPGGGSERIERVTKTAGRQEAVFGTTVPYAVAHEEGLTVSRPKSGGSIEFPERPFLRPALEDVAPLAPEIVKENIVARLRKT